MELVEIEDCHKRARDAQGYPRVLIAITIDIDEEFN